MKHKRRFQYKFTKKSNRIKHRRLPRYAYNRKEKKPNVPIEEPEDARET